MTRILLLCLCLFSPVLWAAAPDDAREALNAGQYEQALQALNQHLSRQPQDAEARFQKGLALVMLERDEEAIQVFSDLARDFPDMPEPYNNLAVLYARAGQYQEARDALEAALVSHPSYATAHENLGDIYAALARAAYNRAIVLDKGNQALEGKLAILAQLDGGQGAGPPTRITVPPREVARATPTPTSAPVAARATPAPTPAATAGPTPRPMTTARAPTPAPRPTPAPLARPVISGNAPVLGSTAPVISDRPPPARPTPRPAPDEAAILAALDRWAKAWSAQDVDAYLATYAPNFEPATGTSRSVWESQRRSRVVRPRSISIQVLQPTVFQGTPKFARVEFLQIYESDTYSDQVRKQIELEKQGAQWLIVSERVAN